MPEKIDATTLASPRATKHSRWIILIWVLAAIGLGAIATSITYGQDVNQSWIAIQAVGHGGSAYADGIAAMRAYHDHPSRVDGDGGPVVLYIYSPLTIPVLRALAWLPGWLLRQSYICAMATGLLLQLWAGYEMASERERRWLVFFLPFAAYFPGLLGDTTILLGNIGYILYGLILAAAIPGWKRNRWLWFYLAVIAASIFKAPMLTLLAFPVLVGRRQWGPAALTGVTGCLLVAVQALLWPVEFREYLLAIRLAFDWQHSFGVGPAGLVGDLLWRMKKPYSSATTIVYLAWAAALAALLLSAGHHVRRHGLLRETWIPIAWVGAILLDPRINLCDTAPLTVPLLLIAWRLLLRGQTMIARRRAKLASSAPIHSRLLNLSHRQRMTIVRPGQPLQWG